MEEIKFRLSDELRKNDHLGEDYVYTAIKHPTIDDIMMVRFVENGIKATTYYQLKDFEKKVNDGHWIIEN